MPRWPEPTPSTPVSPRGFLEYSQHRGFITDPARVRHPRDNPKVERNVQYARERFFKGAEFRDLAHLRSEAGRWFRDVAGMRIHGSTQRQPKQVFPDEKRDAFPPLGRLTLRGGPLAHPEGASRPPYPVPAGPLLGTLRRLPTGTGGGGPAGQQAGSHQPPGLVGQGPPAPARRRPVHRHPGLSRGGFQVHHPSAGPDRQRGGPDGIGGGPVCPAPLRRPLPWARIRQGHKLLRLGERYTPLRLDAAGQRALEVDLIDVRRVERILIHALEQDATPEPPPPGPAPGGRFARPGSAFTQAQGEQL